jgi:hypothetical protein
MATKHANPRARVRAHDGLANSRLAALPCDISSFIRHV